MAERNIKGLEVFRKTAVMARRTNDFFHNLLGYFWRGPFLAVYRSKRLGIISHRCFSLAASFLILLSIAAFATQPFLEARQYKLTPEMRAVLPATNRNFAEKLVYDYNQQTFEFNKGFNPALASDSEQRAGGAGVAVSLGADPKRGVTVTDPYNEVRITLRPNFVMNRGKQSENQVIYQIKNGYIVYTAQANGIKEDIVLEKYSKDEHIYSYTLELDEGLEARLTDDGGLGIYGSDLPIYGDVSTDTDKDVELLQKTRQNSPKTKLLFEIPAPVIKEYGRDKSHATASFRLEGNELTVSVIGLKEAAYPLSIDPSVVVTSATDFLYNANFDMSADFIPASNRVQRGAVTGAVLNAWTNISGAPLTGNGRFLHGTAVYNGYIYAAGGTGTAVTTGVSTVEYALLSTTDNTTGSWASTTSMPAARTRFGLVAYNGYMYAVGGTADSAGATPVNTIYRARINTNGSLGAWSSTTATLPTAKYAAGVAVHDRYLYVVGGKTGSASNTGSTEVVYCPILPSGDIATCTADSGSALPAARYGLDLQAYNGRLYAVGGNLNGTVTGTTLYANIDVSNGSVVETTWVAGPTMTQARENFGATFTTIAGSYLYAIAGCNTVFASQSCNAHLTTSEMVQINADGSLEQWLTSPDVLPASVVGQTVTSWRGAVYKVGGCGGMHGAAILCSGVATQVQVYYATFKSVGGVGQVKTATALPASLHSHGSAVVNGYLYVIGGCNAASCDGGRSARYQTSYAPINADGSIGSWTTQGDPTNATALHYDGEASGGTTSCETTGGFLSGEGTDYCGLAAVAVTTFNGYIYVIGGYDGNVTSNGVYYMRPNSNGSINSWTRDGDNTVSNSQGRVAFAHNGYLYAIGGCTTTGSGTGCTNGNYVTTVERSQINTSDGQPGAWSTTSQLQLSTGRGLASIVFYGGFIYIVAGADNSGAGQLNTVLRAKVDSSNNIVAATGSVWTATTGTLTQVRRRTSAGAANGYLYVFGGHDGSGSGVTLSDIQIGKIDIVGGTGDIASFSASPNTITARWNLDAVFGNGYFYVTGGCNASNPPQCSTLGTTVNEYFQVYNADNFTSSSWVARTAYGTNSVGVAAAVYNGKLYVAGGCTTYTVSTSSCTATIDDFRYATINGDGSLGTWTDNLSAGSRLPANRAFGRMIARYDNLYFMGGHDGTTVQSTVYKMSLDATGVPTGSFSSTGQTALTASLMGHDAYLYGDYIYVTGGFNGASHVNTIYKGRFDASNNIVGWTSQTNTFTTARRDHATVITAGFIYVMGGFDGTNFLNNVQYAEIDESASSTSAATLGTWSYARDLPLKIRDVEAFVAYGYIYAFGGRTASTTCINDTYSASVNTAGGLGDWQQSINEFTTARQGHRAAYHNGYMYVLGGTDCTNILSSNQVMHGGQRSPAIVARYSRYIDFGGNATPRQLLPNGTHSVVDSVGVEGWVLNYRASLDTTNSWGAKNRLNPMTFGAASSNLVPYDASSINQGVSRWWWLQFEMDMVQTFAFTDEAWPRIDNYTFYYSPAANKRLRNGRDFRDETKQNLDTRF